jgi:hypothetical protein
MKFCGFLELELARHRTKNTTWSLSFM